MNKKARILRWIPSLIVAIIVGVPGVLKLISFPPLKDIYSRTGLLEYMNILGAAELLFLAGFLSPRFLKLGFLLLTAYYGGAMAVELSHGTLFVFPALILTLIWIAAFLREPSIFKEFSEKRKMISA